MYKIVYDAAGIKLPAIVLPNISDGTWILVLGVILGIALAVAIIRHLRARLAEKHLRHKLKSSSAKAVRFDADTGTLSVVTTSGETEIPRTPYAHGTLPASGYEGFTRSEIQGGALRLREVPLVVTSSWKTKRFGRHHWTIEPRPASPVMTDTHHVAKTNDHSKPASAAALHGNDKDHGHHDHHPEPAHGAAHH